MLHPPVREKACEPAHSTGGQLNGLLWMREHKEGSAGASTRLQPDSRTHWCRSALPCRRCRVPRHTANHERTSRSSGALDESSRKVQQASAHEPDSRTRWRRSALPCHSRCRAPRQTASHEHMSCSSGALDESSKGGFNRRAHISLILVHVGFGQHGRAPASDEEPPAILRTMSTRDVPAGCWMRAQARFNRRAHFSSLILVHVGAG